MEHHRNQTKHYRATWFDLLLYCEHPTNMRAVHTFANQPKYQVHDSHHNGIRIGLARSMLNRFAYALCFPLFYAHFALAPYRFTIMFERLILSPSIKDDSNFKWLMPWYNRHILYWNRLEFLLHFTHLMNFTNPPFPFKSGIFALTITRHWLNHSELHIVSAHKLLWMYNSSEYRLIWN